MAREGFSPQAGLTPDRLDLLDFLLAEEGTALPADVAISARSSSGNPPASFSQRRMWFLEKWQPGTPTYNISLAYHLSGKLDPQALERALRMLELRHEALRTTFVSDRGEPLQRIEQPRGLWLPLLDLAGLSKTTREEEAKRIRADRGLQPFDLERGPLWRAALLQLAGDEHTLLLELHHIIADGWSVGVLIHDLGAFYRGWELPPPAIQYADFAVWQRQALTDGLLDHERAFWRQQLAGAPALLELPTDRPRPPVAGWRGGTVPFAVPAKLQISLAALPLPVGTTLFMVLLTAFAVLLYRWTEQEDLSVGTPVANRNRPETEGLIGLFVNTLVLRLQSTAGLGFRAFLEQVRERTLAAYDHQDLPFEALVEELQPERDPSRTPLFQVMFLLQNTPQPVLLLPALTLSPVRTSSRVAKLDLTLGLLETEDGLIGSLEYRTELFDHVTMQRLVNHYLHLLAGAVAAPGHRLDALPLLGEAERWQLVAEWNDTAVDRSDPACVQDWIGRQARRSPQAVAVVAEEGELTYAELAERVGRLASYLRHLGVGPEARVCVLAERSLALVVGLLAILEAGGAYVPLDPSYPDERLELLFEESAAGSLQPVVLAQKHLAPRVPGGTGQPPCAIWIEDAEGLPPGQGLNGALPDHPAYVIYTSGSTGRPKGAVTTHRALLNRLLWMQEAFPLGVADRVLQKTPFGFDVSVWELFWPLKTGARLVMARPGGHRDPGYLVQTLAEQGITTVHFVPSLLSAFLAEPAISQCSGLRRVISSGEALPSDLAARFRQRLPGVELHNLYGPTEAAVDVTWWPCRRESGDGVPIGRPISNVAIHLLDPGFAPVPLGATGELYIGGAAPARGYLGRPDLTAERFLPDPLARTPGARLYRTGDLARRLPDGAVLYLGRTDHQIKVRGHRIEPGEIEAALVRHPGVAEAVVVLGELASGERRLTAYYTPSGAIAPGVEELRSFLGASLPEPLVPAIFLRLPALPLTPNGKVDRRALPEIGVTRPGLRTSFVPPHTPTEELLAQIWASVLGLDGIGVHDNFFSLGGDSILTPRVQAMAEERGLRLSVQQLFAHQTIAGQAEIADAGLGPPPPPPTEPFSLLSPEDRLRLPESVVDAYPLTSMQAGMLFHMRYTPEAIVYHNVYTHTLRARFDSRALAEALRRAVIRHPILRTSFDLTRFSEPLQLVHAQADLSADICDLRHLSEEEQDQAAAALIERERRLSFDIARPPLVRFYVRIRADDRFDFTFTEFHPAFDGWSLHSLLAEVLETYSSLLDGRPCPEAPALRSTVRDFVALERAVLESRQSRAFWAERLEDSEALALPRWRATAAPAAPYDARIRYVELPLPGSLFTDLRELARSAALPLKSFLLAVHLKVLSLATGRNDVITGLLTNGRPEGPDSDKVLGLFFNVVPFRLRIARGSWLDLARETFAAEREIHPFSRYPLAQLQSSRGGRPLFEVLFNYVHFHVLRDSFQSGGFEVEGGFRRWEETNLPLSVTFMQDPLSRSLRLVLRHHVAELTVGQVKRIRTLYEESLRALVQDPEGPHDPPLRLSAPERHQVLLEWNDTGAGGPCGGWVHERIAAQAQRFPEAPAISGSGGPLTYAWLLGEVGRLTGRLRGWGVGPETRVGVYLPRSPEAVVACLAVLAAGGAFVPLDPLHPLERTAALLDLSGATVFLSHERLAAALPPVRARLVPFEGREAEAGPGRELAAHVDGASPAYVVFTSGSTGVPKGVIVEHRQLASYVEAVLERLDLPPGSSCAVISTLSADLGYTAVFPCLCTGGCLDLPTGELAADAAALTEAFARRPVDLLKVVPSHLAALLAASPDPGRLLPRARLVFGGEALDWSLVERVRALAPGCEVLNHYGPTEATVGVAAGRAGDRSEGFGSATVPLGRPLAGTEIFVLDGDLQPVPIGLPGELCLGGNGLARGYLNQPAATAERFVPHPSAARPGARLYRTGDRGRWLPDGRIEFLGRLDDQVKIRGIRIELREVEAVLAGHPAVRECAVAVRRDAAGEPRLVAWVVLEDGKEATDPDLRSYLRRRLPDPMVPAAFVRLAFLTRHTNGKIDRRSLPPPGEISACRAERRPPRNHLERLIAGVWAEVLTVDNIGIDHNFFDLGGHSLVLLRVHGRLREMLQRDLPMVALFEHPTIADLARYLGQAADTAEAGGQDAGERAVARHRGAGQRAVWRRAARSARPEEPS